MRHDDNASNLKISRFPDYKPRADENLESAKKCAARIRKYYADRGIVVKIELVPKPHKAGTIYEIKTHGIPGAK